MTDNEIIKALECCVKAPYCSEKTDFPYKGIDDCVKTHTLDALDLINRQKAKVEALQMDNEQLETDNFNANMNCEHLQAEIERLKAEADMADGYEDAYCERVRAEAVKEFAERLKEKVESYDVYDGYKITIRFAVEEDTIDNLVKEMVGAESG